MTLRDGLATVTIGFGTNPGPLNAPLLIQATTVGPTNRLVAEASMECGRAASVFFERRSGQAWFRLGKHSGGHTQPAKTA